MFDADDGTHMNKRNRYEQIVAELAAEPLDSSALPDIECVRSLLSLAVRLYGMKSEEIQHDFVCVDESVTPTDTVAVCSSLLRAQNLNPFDLTLWFARGHIPQD